jgi:hypothetical protein
MRALKAWSPGKLVGFYDRMSNEPEKEKHRAPGGDAVFGV